MTQISSMGLALGLAEHKGNNLTDEQLTIIAKKLGKYPKSLIKNYKFITTVDNIIENFDITNCDNK